MLAAKKGLRISFRNVNTTWFEAWFPTTKRRLCKIEGARLPQLELQLWFCPENTARSALRKQAWYIGPAAACEPDARIYWPAPRLPSPSLPSPPPPRQMAAVTLDSESELRRSGGFELIFPVAGTANKYLKFFDGPRPLERTLANAAFARDKAASGGASALRGGLEECRAGRTGGQRCRKGRDSNVHRRASSVDPIR